MSAAVNLYDDRALLPPSAAPWMRAASLVSAERRPLDIDVIRRIWDPWTCPAPFLPFLAHAFAVKLWEDNWNESRQRSIIANSIEMHAAEGTLYGLIKYLSYVDVEVLKTVTPPQKVFSGASLTREQREAWLSKLPQVRVYRPVTNGRGLRRVFTGGPMLKQFAARHFFQPSDCLARLAPVAEWVIKGVVQGAFVEPYNDGGYRIRLRGTAGRATFLNTLKARKRFLLPSTAAQRLLTVSPTANAPWRSPVSPSLKPVTSLPERVAVPGTGGSRVYCGRPISPRRFFQPSSAPRRMFSRFAVNDGSVQIVKRPAVQFMNVGQYGAPPHTAVVRLKIRGRRPLNAAGAGRPRPGKRFWIPHDPVPMQRLKRAVVAAKRRSDVILVDTNSRTTFTLNQPWPLGQSFKI